MPGLRRLAAAVTSAVLVAACGADPGPDSDGEGDNADPPTSTLEPDDPDDDPVAETTTSGQPDASPGAATAPPPDSPTSAAPTPVIDGAVPVGQFAPAVLRPDVSDSVVIEIHADQAPRPSTVDHLRATLTEVTGKPVDVVQGAAPGAGAADWDAASLRSAADRGATVAQGNGMAVVRILFVHGSFDGDDGTLGAAVRGDVAAVFVDQVGRAAGVLGSIEAIERSVTTHELGHLLGLVDLYLDTGRGDPQHPGHSPNRDSVMFWAVESDAIGQLLGADPPDSFDASDRADLEAIRSGA